MTQQAKFKFGGQRSRYCRLKTSHDLLAVRIQGKGLLHNKELSTDAYQSLRQCESIFCIPEAGVEVFRVTDKKSTRKVRDHLRLLLRKESNVRFAGRCLHKSSGAPVLYTENLFIKFNDRLTKTACEKLIKTHKLTLKRPLTYAKNAYFVSGVEGCGQSIFDTSLELLKHDSVDLCHPELIQMSSNKSAFDNQWHLKKTRINGRMINAHAHIEEAWTLSQGDNMTIAIIDDGVDLAHAEFAGSQKIVAPRDVTRRNNNPNPRSNDRHGTACAGVACANGLDGASGVAPKSTLLPIRLASHLGSQAEADAFVWAADHGADVISCSWGPADGVWWDDNDPLHDEETLLPDSTRLAIDYAVQQGRNGKGCVITWAAGNGNEPVEHDGYASYDKVLAIAACNDENRKSAYSDFGSTIFCCFPSSHGVPSLTPGIWTTDNTGISGYNTGAIEDGDHDGDYTNSFGGTSSACPGVAGVAALILSINPDLRWDQVKDIMQRSCDKIDTTNGDYDESGHSPIYGYGRINAKKALEMAVPSTPPSIRYSIEHKRVESLAIQDNKETRVQLNIADNDPLLDVKVSIDIQHSWIGDLSMQLLPPASLNIAPIMLHNRDGESSVNLRKTYDSLQIDELNQLKGHSPKGLWKLKIKDHANHDEGQLVSVALIFGF